MYREYLIEFWYSAKALENSKVSLSVLIGGIYGEVGVNTFRNAIGAHYLPYSREYVAPSSIDIVGHEEKGSLDAPIKLTRAKLNKCSEDADLLKDMSGPKSPPELQRSWRIEGHIRFGVISSVLAQRYLRIIRQRVGPGLTPREDGSEAFPLVSQSEFTLAALREYRVFPGMLTHARAWLTYTSNMKDLDLLRLLPLFEDLLEELLLALLGGYLPGKLPNLCPRISMEIFYSKATLPEQVQRDQELLPKVLQRLLILRYSSFPLPSDETPSYYQPFLKSIHYILLGRSSKTRALWKLSCLLEAARQSLACIRLDLQGQSCLHAPSTSIFSVLTPVETMLYLLHRHCSLPPEETSCSLPPEETSCSLPPEETSCSLPPEETSCSLPPEETLLLSYCLWT
ncbi:hypothetical protein Tco_1067772 [Tanacetum coccineum]|uniref:Uncharacterized protein n=1 Tax=Tanacetum coccineum TaxID=301880 RepID=A0ABQ5HFP4_9ASTR